MITMTRKSDLASRFFNPEVDRVSKRLYQLTLVIIAILLPLDRIGFLSILHLSILTLVLLAQRWLYLWGQSIFTDRKSVFSRASYTLLLPIVAAGLIQLASPLVQKWNHAVFALILLAIKAFIIAQVTDEADLTVFEKAMIVVCGLVVAFGFYQYFADIFGAPLWISGLSEQYASGWTYFFPRPQSTALEPLYLGYYLILPLALLSIRLLRGKVLAKWERWVLLGGLALMLTTLARGAIIGFLFAIIICLIGLRPDKRLLKSFGKYAGVALIITLALTAFTGIIKHSNTFSSFNKHAVDLNDESAQTRYKGINPALRAFLSKPILGHGITENDTSVHLDNAPSLKYNNSYLTFIVEEGLLGLALYAPFAWLIWRALRQAYKDKFSSRFAPYVVAIIAMAVQVSTFEAFQLLRTWVVLAVFIVAYNLPAIVPKSSKK